MTGRRAVALTAAVTAVALAATVWGPWWATFAAGVALGIALRRGPVAAACGLAAGALAWGLPLAWLGLSAPVGRVASVVSGILGLGTGPAPALTLTVLLGALLGVVGAWLGAAGRAALIAVATRGTAEDLMARPPAPVSRGLGDDERAGLG